MKKDLLPIAVLAAAMIINSCTHEQPQENATVVPQTNYMPGMLLMPGAPGSVYTGSVNPLSITGKDQPGYVNAYPVGSYEHFVASPEYPNTMKEYINEPLMKQLTAQNSKLIICIPQQRARVYVNGRVGMDWPVSTGTNGHETPTGVFRVIEKNKDHHSNRYGKFVNAQGRTTDSNADASKGTPEGMTFRPASMPNWHRLTWDGVGVHGGKVIAGRRLSHGCIRTPFATAAKFFEYSAMGMPAYITRAVEDYYKGGAVKPIDVKYRPKPGNDYTDLPITPKTIPATTAPTAS